MAQYQSDLPPELVKLFDKLQTFRKGFQGGGHGLIIVLFILLLIAAFSSFYTVDPDEAGVILRFGKYVDTTPPGLHFKLPFGVDKVYRVQLTTVRKEEFGFRTAEAGIVSRYEKGRGFDQESLMLTGDLNVADVEWIVQFRVNDPGKFLFNVRNVRTNLRDVSEAIMRLVVGDRSVSEILTTGRVAIADEAKIKMQEVYDNYDMGIIVTNVILQDVNPPEAVKDSFNEVNAAKQEQDKMVNEAWEEYNRAVPEEKGKAEQTIAVAEGYANEIVNMAKGETNRFIAMYNAYRLAPDVTKLRIYLEKMKDLFAKAGNVYIMDPSAKTLLPHINLREFGSTEGGEK